MSLAIAHFAVGAACTGVALTLLPRIPFQRTLVVLGGIWAVIPDAWRFLPASAGGYAHDFHATAWANLFWFHNVLDRADVGDSHATGVVLLGGLLCVTAAAEYRDYRTPEPVREALPEAVSEDH
ncbi:hypothetical protein ACFQMA_15955 [Halosimplex aquaticum]|uniref:LexA-binding, inner membrane-associated hydrolase n=1 Tax=Halosimplex aquaticum TaxID=3026162 RepID=A0ABD5Y6H5_9EURY|nr:hypothetical protein [Halosimplex aquaticum]